MSVAGATNRVPPRNTTLALFVGQHFGYVPPEDLTTALYTGNRADQVTTMQVTGASQTYAFSVADETGDTRSLSIDLGAVPGSAAAAATALTDYLNETDGVDLDFLRGLLADGRVTVATDTLTFTGRDPAITFTLTESDANLGTPSTTTAASTGADLNMGRVVYGTGISTAAGAELTATALTPATADLTAQVVTGDVTYAAGAQYWVYIRHNGVVYSIGPVAANTDSPTTRDDIFAAINTEMPPNSVIAAAGAANTFTVTAEAPGDSFELWASSSLASSDIDVTYTTGAPGDPASDIVPLLLGIVPRSTAVHSAAGQSDGVYSAGTAVPVLTKGLMAVEVDAAITYGGQVFLGTASGEEGLLYSAAGTDRIPLSRSRAYWVGNDPTTNDRALVAFNFGL